MAHMAVLVSKAEAAFARVTMITTSISSPQPAPSTTNGRSSILPPPIVTAKTHEEKFRKTGEDVLSAKLAEGEKSVIDEAWGTSRLSPGRGRGEGWSRESESGRGSTLGMPPRRASSLDSDGGWSFSASATGGRQAVVEIDAFLSPEEEQVGSSRVPNSCTFFLGVVVLFQTLGV